MENDRYKKYIDLFMIGILICIILGSLIKTVFFARDINYYENRSAEKIGSLSIKNFFCGQFQDSMELAFSDQILGSITMKKSYNLVKNNIVERFYSFSEKNMLKENYIAISDTLYRIGGADNLVYKIYNKDAIMENIENKINNINNAIDRHPELKFLIFYIERDRDIDFESNEKLGISNYIFSKIQASNADMKIFEINSFDEYKEKFYETDTHWNAKGSYMGYQQILKAISNEAPLKPLKEIKLNVKFSGSKALMAGGTDVYKEDFRAYIFDIPGHKTYIAGNLGSYGKESFYEKNLDRGVSYAEFYGDDVGEVEFDFNAPEKENLLIIGESYDNAIIKLLATHFNKTYSIDLRSYEAAVRKKFSFDEYIKEKNIDRVILIGNVDYYIKDTFNI